MMPCGFAESNCVLDKPPDMTYDECQALQVWRGLSEEKLQLVISCWKLTKEELDEINRTGRLWLTIIGNTMPPVSITVDHPWREVNASECK